MFASDRLAAPSRRQAHRRRNLTIALLNLNPAVPAPCRTLPSSPDWTFSAHLDSKGIQKNELNPQIVTLTKIKSESLLES